MSWTPGIKIVPGTILILFLILSIAVLLGSYRLGERSLWQNEVFAVQLAEKDISEILETSVQNHGPFYFLILHFWCKMGSSEAFLRTSSLIFGILTIPLMYLFSCRLFNRETGTLSAFFLAISGFFILHARELWVYAPFGFFAICSLYTYYLFLKKGSNIFWAGWLISSVVGLYLHFSMFFLIIVQNIFIFLFSRQPSVSKRRWILGQVAIIIFCLPQLRLILRYLPMTYYIVLTRKSFPLILGYLGRIAYVFYSFSLGQTVLPVYPLVVIYAVIVFGGLTVWGLVGLIKAREKLIFVALFGFLPILAFCLVKNAQPRYMYPSFFFSIGIVSCGISRLKSLPKIWAFFSVTLFSLYSVFNYFAGDQFHNMAYLEPYRDVASYVRVHAEDSDLSLQDNVVFVGHVSYEELVKFYNACNIFVMPSRELLGRNDMIEGYGMSYLEANACGKSVIGGRSGGVEDAVVHGKTGLLVDPLNIKELTDAICWLLADETLAGELGHIGRKRTEEELNWSRITTKLKELMEEVT